ncbi:hypothetical protein [Gimesia fumaroli]|uniref:Uncharacterized protein n=1 Tax=Gimesia fumaroli TaxID=2527976 RepID=A0A518IJK8_9PLAN|nr:hypothetical protein [Gimesia fumaroli]QDV53279.1 hypothetical protein Enr17x_53510 [Gimesia fumaroli]
MQSKTDAVNQAQSKPNKKSKALKLVLCMGLVMGSTLLLMPTQQAEAGGCYSGYGYGGYGYSYPSYGGYYNSYPSYGSGGFYYSSPSFGIGIYSGGRGYGGYRSGYRGGYRSGHRGHGHHGGHRGHGHHGHH